MDFGVPPIARLDPAVAGPRAGDARRPAPPEADFRLTLNKAIEGPPRELRTDITTAAGVYEQLHAMGRELSFHPDPDGGPVVVELRDLDGNLIRRLPPSAVLEIASGAGLP